MKKALPNIIITGPVNGGFEYIVEQFEYNKYLDNISNNGYGFFYTEYKEKKFKNQFYSNTNTQKIFNEKKILFDSSPYYFLNPEYFIKTIRDSYQFPDEPNIIIVIDNPTVTIFKLWNTLRKRLKEPLLFQDSINEMTIKERKKENWDPLYDYINNGMYCKKIRYYKRNFKNVKVICYEDLLLSPQKILSETLSDFNIKDFKIKSKNIFFKNINSKVKSFIAPVNNIIYTKGDKIKQFLDKFLSNKMKLKVLQNSEKFLKKNILKDSTIAPKEIKRLNYVLFHDDILDLSSYTKKQTVRNWLN